MASMHVLLPGRVLLVLAGCLLLTGCASTGATPRPFPTPDTSRVPRAPDAGPAHTAAPGQAADAMEVGGLARQLIDVAVGLVGTPYRAGGSTPEAGFDCSGFVSWVFGKVGLPVPRTVRDQFAAGQPIDSTPAVRAGDLMFFDTGPGQEPTHVAVALGDGRFVHAPSSRGAVRIEPLSAEYWARRYLGARRLIVEPDSGRE